MMRRIAVQLCTMLCIAMATASAAAKETMLFVYYYDYPPFGWEVNGTMRGIYVDIVDELFGNRLGVPVQHKGYPWNRAQKMVENGMADGYLTVITSGRLSFSDATQQPVINVDFKLFVPKNSPKLSQLRQVSSISDLRGFKLVDYAGSGWAKNNLVRAGLDVHWLHRNEQLWKYLLAGRADATVNNEWTTRYALKKEGYEDQFIELPHPMTPTPISFHIFIGKKSPFLPYLNKADDELKQMKEDGILQGIYDRYK